MREEKRIGVVNYKWKEKGRVISVDVMKEKERKIGI